MNTQNRQPFSFRGKGYPKAVFATMLFLCLIVGFPSLAMTAATYYVSAAGNDVTNNGTSSSSPFKTLTKVSTLKLKPGDHILLKCGDTFTDGLYPQGSGTAVNPITIASYGTGNRPVIAVGYNHIEVADYHKGWYGIKLVNVAGYKIKDIEFKDEAVGISVLYLNTFNNDFIWIENCFFHDIHNDTIMDRYSGKALFDPAEDILFCSGISIAGVDADQTQSIMVKNITIKKCTFDYCDNDILTIPHGFTDRYYTSTGDYKHIRYQWGVKDDEFSNITIDSCSMYHTYDCASVYINGTAYFTMTNSIVNHHSWGIGTNLPFGSAALQFTRCKECVVDNCQILNTLRPSNNCDGVAIDFEADNTNITIQNCTVAGGQGPVYQSLCSNVDWPDWTGTCTNMVLKNCILRENGTGGDNGFNTALGRGCCICGTGSIQNCLIYLAYDSQDYRTSYPLDSMTRVWNKSGTQVHGPVGPQPR